MLRNAYATPSLSWCSVTWSAISLRCGAAFSIAIPTPAYSIMSVSLSASPKAATFSRDRPRYSVKNLTPDFLPALYMISQGAGLLNLSCRLRLWLFLFCPLCFSLILHRRLLCLNCLIHGSVQV